MAPRAISFLQVHEVAGTSEYYQTADRDGTAEEKRRRKTRRVFDVGGRRSSPAPSHKGASVLKNECWYQIEWQTGGYGAPEYDAHDSSDMHTGLALAVGR